MKQFRKQKGFTLVEIMIVVAIIGLLAAIAIPNLLRARMSSNDGAIQDDLRAFSSAAESFRGDQQPPQYGTLAQMTGAAPPYIDASWAVAPLVKHGHTLVYATVGAPAQSYTMSATRVANAALNAYCVDSGGALHVLVNSAAAPTVAAGACTDPVVTQ